MNIWHLCKLSFCTNVSCWVGGLFTNRHQIWAIFSLEDAKSMSHAIFVDLPPCFFRIFQSSRLRNGNRGWISGLILDAAYFSFIWSFISFKFTPKYTLKSVHFQPFHILILIQNTDFIHFIHSSTVVPRFYFYIKWWTIEEIWKK